MGTKKVSNNNNKLPRKAGSSVAKKGGKSSTDGMSSKAKILKLAADAYCNGEGKLARDKIVHCTGLMPKTVSNTLPKLLRDGLIEYPEPKFICLTEAGIQYMGDDCKILTPEEKQSKRMETLKGKPLRMYELLKDGSTWLKDDVAKQLDFSGKKQKGFVNLVGKLRSEGMIEYPDKDHMKMTDLWLGQ